MHILLADDHVLFRDALIQFIHALRPEWVITTSSDLNEAKTKLSKSHQKIDLIILDLRMPGMDGLLGLEKIIKKYPHIKTAILSGVAEEHHVKQAMAIGACAYFPKTLSGKILTKAIELIVNTNQKFVPMDESGTKIMPAYFDDFSYITVPDYCEKDKEKNTYKHILSTLTKREKQVLYYLAQGLSNSDIATELKIKPATVKLHVSGICKKLEVKNRTQAAITAHQHGLIHDICI